MPNVKHHQYCEPEVILMCTGFSAAVRDTQEQDIFEITDAVPLRSVVPVD